MRALVAPRRGEMVADFCAGAGGKSLAMGALMRNSGRIYAFDVSDPTTPKFLWKKTGTDLPKLGQTDLKRELQAR